MNGRLQRGLAIVAALYALGWVLWAWHTGLAPVWRLGGAVLVVLLHAGILGLQFMLAATVADDAAAVPAPRPAERLRAWLGECGASMRVFGWWQPWRAGSIPDQPPVAGVRGVLFVHGYCCNRGFWTPWLHRCRRRGVPFVALSLEPAFGSIDDYAPQLDAAVRRLFAGTGLAPLIVAHSMGGLAVRAWWHATADAPALVRRIITIGTPHHGTWLARLGHTRNARQMRLGSAWGRELGGRAGSGFAERCTCVYSRCDNIVFPPSSALLPGAAALHVPAVGHLALGHHARVIGEAESWLGGEGG